MRKLSQLKQALLKKEADLDMLDDQIMSLPTSSVKFDSLAQKREDMETDIRQLREGIEVLNAWDTLKGGDWSDEMKQSLGEIDPLVVEMATGEADEGMGMDDLGMGAPLPPPAPAVEPPPLEEPVAPPPVEENTMDEIPSGDELAGEEPPAEEPPVEEEPPAEEAPITASSKKSNFPTPSKKGTPVPTAQKKGNTTMATATETTKSSSLKDRIAAIKSKRAEAINKEAQTRVASAWTVAKTLLPTAPATIQQKLAESLLANTTKALKAICRQTARNAAFQKTCEAIASVTKTTMNDLMENPSILASEESAVKSELKGDPKSATTKKADDRKDAGPVPPAYPEPIRKEPAEIDAGKAGDREKDTVDKTMSDQKVTPKEAAKTKKACSACGKDHLEGECSMAPTASKKTKKAGPEDMAPPAAGPTAPPVEEGGDMPLPPLPEEGEGEEKPEGESEEVVGDEEKLEVVEQIDEVIQDIEQIKDDIEENSEELNLESIFDNDKLEDKEASLANNGNVTAGEDDNDFLPSSAQNMEASMEESPIGDMFDLTASDADPMARLLGSTKYAEVDASLSKVVKPGDIAQTFKTDAVGKDPRDNETDHEDSLLTDILKSLDQDDYDTTRDQTSHQEEPTEANTKVGTKKSITKLKTVVAAAPAAESNLASLLFSDDDM